MKRDTSSASATSPLALAAQIFGEQINLLKRCEYLCFSCEMSDCLAIVILMSVPICSHILFGMDAIKVADSKYKAEVSPVVGVD